MIDEPSDESNEKRGAPIYAIKWPSNNLGEFRIPFQINPASKFWNLEDL